MFVFFVLFVSVRLFVPFFFFFFKENDIHKGLYRNTVSFELIQLAISNKLCFFQVLVSVVILAARIS